MNLHYNSENHNDNLLNIKELIIKLVKREERNIYNISFMFNNIIDKISKLNFSNCKCLIYIKYKFLKYIIKNIKKFKYNHEFILDLLKYIKKDIKLLKNKIIICKLSEKICENYINQLFFKDNQIFSLELMERKLNDLKKQILKKQIKTINQSIKYNNFLIIIMILIIIIMIMISLIKKKYIKTIINY